MGRLKEPPNQHQASIEPAVRDNAQRVSYDRTAIKGILKDIEKWDERNPSRRLHRARKVLEQGLDEQTNEQNDPDEHWMRLMPPVLRSIPIGGRSSPRVGDPVRIYADVIPDSVKYMRGVPWGEFIILLVMVLKLQGYDQAAIETIAATLNHGFALFFHVFPTETIEDWDAEQYLAASFSDVAPLELQQIRTRFWFDYATSTGAVQRWLESLTDTDRRVYQRYALPGVDLSQHARLLVSSTR